MLSFGLNAQTQAPEREWSQIDWPRVDPETGQQVAQQNSGEDWWYDHKNTYDANGNHTGYVAVGFNYGIGRITDYDLTDLNNDGFYDGMAYCNANEQDYKLEIFESPGNVRRCGRAMMMAYDLNGKSLWCRSYNEGEFVAVTQTADGGFLALGYTSTTVNMPNNVQNNYAPASQRPVHISATNYLFYNPIAGSALNHFDAKATQTIDPNTGRHIMTTPNYTRYGRRPFLVKTNAAGEVLWNYQYGGFDFATQEDEAFSQHMVWGDVAQNGNGYLLAYSASDNVSNGSPVVSFVISIDQNGMVLWKQQLLGNGTIAYAIAKHPNNNQFAISGRFEGSASSNGNINAFVTMIDLNVVNGFSQPWNILGKNYQEFTSTANSQGWKNTLSTDVDFKNSGELILPYLATCNICTYSGGNIGEGKVALLNAATGSVSTTKSIGPCNAYDFKLAATPTFDGGFALLTSKGEYDANGSLTTLSYTDPTLLALYPDSWFTDQTRTVLVNAGNIHGNVNKDLWLWMRYWNTDTYIVKFDANNNQEWEQKYNVDESPRQAYPGDLKKQECMYAISQAADGGFVASGNSSHNFDDALLLKTYPPCQKELTFEPTSIGYDDIRINAPTFWLTNKVVGHNVIIDHNSTLTIDGATIQFGDADQLGRQVRIHVMPGSKLRLINGAKLTSVNACQGSKWLGINVYGRSSFPQTSNLQGTLEIVGTANNPIIIENAVDAISTNGFVNYNSNDIAWNSFGGIIKADYCRFENNLRDVAFWEYNHFENGIWQPNASYFNHCTFIKDRSFVNARAYRGAAVSMWDVQGVTFTACTFDNSALTLEEQQVTNGIYGLNANFTVQWDCQNPNTQTGCTNADSSYFKGMEYGIRAEYTLGFSGPRTKVHGTEFKSTNGLYIGGSYNNIATRNSFYVEKLPAFTYPDIPYGLYFDYATNFTAQENAFYTRGTTGHNAGMVVNNHGSLYQLVYNNTFDDYLLGLSAQGENRSTNGGLSGLECRCNDFTQGEYDMFVYGNPNQPWNGIQREQGAYVQNRPDLLASNLFSLSGGLYSDYFNLPDYINYHHHKVGFNGNSTRLEPLNIFNVNKVGYESDYNTNSCLPLISSGKTSGVWQLELANAEQDVEADEILLEQLLNEDGNWQLEAEILFASQYNEWYDVYMDMMNQSPYLDHGIIEDLINDPNFPDLMLRNIMLANPDAAKAQHLLDLIYLRNMPAWMVADIEAGKSSYGAKEVLVGRIGYNKGVQQNAIAGLLGIYGSSTSYNGLDSAIALLNTREEVTYAYLLADAYLTKGQYTQAASLVNGLQQTRFFSAKDSLDYAAYQNWYALRATMVETNQTWFEADSTQRASLRSLADTANHNAPMLWANHALKLLGEEVAYREPVYLPNPVSSKTNSSALAGDNNSLQDFVKVFPNPASDIINVIADGADNLSVELYTIDGKLVTTHEGRFGSAILNVKDFDSGVYLLKVIFGQGISETVRVSVVK